MIKQTTLNISFPKKEVDLHNELLRVSQLMHTPTTLLVRGFIREGLKNLPTEAKMICGLQYQHNH